MKKMYFNPHCSKCRVAAETFDAQGVAYEKFKYLEETFTKEDIREILTKGNLSIDDILRQSEPEYLEHIKDRNLTDDEKTDVLIRHPKILQRPIVVSETSAVVARDEESVKQASL